MFLSLGNKGYVVVCLLPDAKVGFYFGLCKRGGKMGMWVWRHWVDSQYFYCMVLCVSGFGWVVVDNGLIVSVLIFGCFWGCVVGERTSEVVVTSDVGLFIFMGVFAGVCFLLFRMVRVMRCVISCLWLVVFLCFFRRRVRSVRIVWGLL